MAGVGSVLPPGLRRPPYFHRVDHYEEFPGRILDALAAEGEATDFGPARRAVTPPDTIRQLFARLHELSPAVPAEPPVHGGALDGLDIRLGRHHGLASGTNAVAMSVRDFTALLTQDERRVAEAVRATADPELALASGPTSRRRRLFRRAR
jgi:hypothetical protein